MWIKICGVTTVGDALLAAESGADALGLNFIEGSPRALDRATARRVADAVRGRVELIGVVADLATEQARALLAELALDALQLHGHEPPSAVAALLPRAYQAVRIGGPEDAARAAGYGGERLLCDARVAGALGGTGASFDWALVRGLARQRRVIVAGGLTPDNVARAIAAVEPFGVDVASGVEASPRQKDAERVRRFIERARQAARRPDIPPDES
ncbi:MAG: phosphoribosylanthranilate isomerase [Sorangiineae bacterium]|nr:phosphoribosylanthranilate isomerase [Polyangiaceae bacterium]MEB2323277.1 phosphoribosylanthranilate isomerase [Sorangiineae bacterium]